MSCDPRDILLYIEGELAPEDAARVRAHVATCAPCREMLDAELELDRALGSLDDLECPDDFAAETVTRARCDLTHAVGNPHERRRALYFSAGLSAISLALLWPTGLLDPVLRTLGPIRCVSRCVLSGLANSSMSALLVGRAISRHVLEAPGAVIVALAAFVLLLTMLVLLVVRYHRDTPAEPPGR